MKSILKSLLIISLLFSTVKTEAQIQYTNSLTANQMVEAIIGSGVSYSNATLNCHPSGSGTFTNGNNTVVGMDGGIILTSGRTEDAVGPNNAPGTTFNSGKPGDSDLNAIANGNTNDACILEFDFVPLAHNIEFKYVFASEEYEEYFCSQYNDVFGFFITGPNPNGGTYNKQNVALLPDNSTVVSINNVGPSTCNSVNNSQYYNNNDNGQDIEYDGYLDKLTATLSLVAGQSYHIKLAIADVGDSALDSGVYIEVGSFASFCIDIASSTGNVNCLEPEIGYINQTITSGIPPYSFTWSNGATTEDLSNLSEGTYTCTITDQSQECELEVREYTIINTEGDYAPPALPACSEANEYSCVEAEALTLSDFPNIITSNELLGNCLVEITAKPVSISKNYDCAGGSLSVTYQVSDNHNNNYDGFTCTHSVIAADAPDFTEFPADITINCIDPTPVASTILYTNNLQGTCEKSEKITSVISGSPIGCGDSYLETWTATDVCGHSKTHTRNIIVEDNNPPSLTFNNPLFSNLQSGETFTIECEGEENNWTLPDLSINDVNVEDDCHEFDVVYTQTLITKGECLTDGFIQEYKLVWIATDQCQNVDSIYLYMHLIDTKPPVFFNTPEDVTVSCDMIPEIDKDYDIYAIDDCMCEFIYTEDVLDNEGCIDGKILYRTWRTVDCCKNEASYTQKITIVDDVPPTFTFVNPLFDDLNSGDVFLVQCRGKIEEWAIPELTTEDVVAVDNCQDIAEVTIAQTSLSEGDCIQDGYIKEYKYTWTASDICGNVDSVNIIMRIVDTIPPVFFNTPEDITVSCNYIPNAGVDYSIYATDECLCSQMVVEDQVDYSQCLDEKTLYRTWTSTDCCNNSTSFTQKITIRDFTAPTLEVTLPNGEVVNGDASFDFDCHTGGIPSEWLELDITNASSSDDCNGEVQLDFKSKHTGADNNKSAVDSYTFTYTSTDVCGNSSEIVILVHAIDNMAPTILDFNEKVCSSEDPTNFVAFDECTNQTSIQFTERPHETCNTMFYRDFEVKDPSGNTTLLTQTVYHTSPNGPEILDMNPMLENMGVKDTLLVHCSGNIDETMSGLHANDIEFSQDCSNSTIVHFNENMIEDFHCHGDKTMALVEVTWEATDMCGHTNSVSAMVHIIADQTASLSAVPNEITVACKNEIADIELDSQCGIQELMETFDTIPGECVNEFTVTRSIQVMDECNNISKVEQTIIVEDKIGPSFENLPKYICGDFSIPNNVIATDGCTGIEFKPMLIKEDTIESNICQDRLIIKRTWQAEDECQNVSTFEQFLSEPTDLEPTIIFSKGIEELAGNTTTFVQSNKTQMDLLESINKFSIVAYDPCINYSLDYDFEHTSSFADNCELAGYKTQHDYVYTFTDLCGKTTTIEFSIQVEDDINPLSNNIEEEYNMGCHVEPNYSNLKFPSKYEIIDSDDVSIEKEISVSYKGDMKIVTVLWTLSDACNNTSTLTQHYNVINNQTFEAQIIEVDTVYCDSHKNIIYCNTQNGQPPYSYNWNIEGKECYIQGESNHDSLIVYMGFYGMNITVEVTDADGCISHSELYLACSSDFEARANSSEQIPEIFTIYELNPNPASDKIFFEVDMPATNNLSYIITSTDGKILDKDQRILNAGKQEVEIDISKFRNGIYLMKVSSFDSYKVMKFIVQK